MRHLKSAAASETFLKRLRLILLTRIGAKLLGLPAPDIFGRNRQVASWWGQRHFLIHWIAPEFNVLFSVLITGTTGSISVLKIASRSSCGRSLWFML